MKRGIAWLLFMCVLALAVSAIAEESFTMAGYDDSGTGHVWETNLFFQRMEEKTGVHFAFQRCRRSTRCKTTMRSGSTRRGWII